MSPEFAYFLKVNVAFMLFYAFYRLFFYKDTFFKLRRSILLIFFLLALVYPLMNFQEWIKEQEPIADVIYLYSTMLPETIIDSEATQTMDWKGLSQMLFSGVYWSFIAFLLARFLIQLGSIIWLALKSNQKVIHDTKVHLLDRPSGPFSFFKLIFLHPENHSEKEIDEILIHEKTHVKQWHSIDVILSELICIICWINPFAWLLKREVRHNLEYLADNTVLQSGYDSKSYQYHLLGLAHHNQSAGNIYNSFNVLHLKNRITMMNKKRSHSIGRTKYLIFIPLAAILMLLSNIEAVARITKDMAMNTMNKEEIVVTAIEFDRTFAPELPALPTEMEMEDVSAPLESDDELQRKAKAKKTIFTMVDHMPEFPGGEAELLKFISNNIKYPADAMEGGVQGRVICSFIVNEDGTISDAEIMRGVSPSIDQEAIRVVNSMPVWKPGKQRDQVVAVKYTVPITFRLTKRGEDTKKQETNQSDNDPERIYTTVAVMPTYPGGEEALLKYINTGIKYPVEAQEKGIQGRVICCFVVEKDGSLSNFEILRGVDPQLDEEAIRVLSTMEKWTPGREKGRVVRVKYTVPLTFRLQ